MTSKASIAFVAVVLQMAVAQVCNQQNVLLPNWNSHQSEIIFPKNRAVPTIPPKYVAQPTKIWNSPIVSACSPQVISVPRQVISAPPQVISTPSQVISGPRQVISATPQVISAPRQVISATPQVISAPRQVITAPPQVISAPRQVISAPSQVISAPRQVISAPTISATSSIAQIPAHLIGTTIIDNSISNSLTDTLQLLIVSDLIQSSLGPNVAVSAYPNVVAPAPLRPALPAYETITPAPVQTTYETPVVTETKLPNYAPSTIVETPIPSYVENVPAPCESVIDVPAASHGYSSSYVDIPVTKTCDSTYADGYSFGGVIEDLLASELYSNQEHASCY